MSEEKETKHEEMKCVFQCHYCGCKIVCTTPGKEPLICCDHTMACSYKSNKKA